MPFAYKHPEMNEGPGSEIDPNLTRENTPHKKGDNADTYCC